MKNHSGGNHNGHTHPFDKPLSIAWIKRNLRLSWEKAIERYGGTTPERIKYYRLGNSAQFQTIKRRQQKKQRQFDRKQETNWEDELDEGID